MMSVGVDTTVRAVTRSLLTRRHHHKARGWLPSASEPLLCLFCCSPYQSTYSGKRIFVMTRNSSVDLLWSSASSRFTFTTMTASSSGR